MRPDDVRRCVVSLDLEPATWVVERGTLSGRTTTGRSERGLPPYEEYGLRGEAQQQHFLAAFPVSRRSLEVLPGPAYLTPPLDSLGCALWTAKGYDGFCPAAATCLYRPQILTRAVTPPQGESPRKVMSGDTGSKAANLFLLSAASGPTEDPEAADSPAWGAFRLPPVVLEATPPDVFFSLGASLLRKLLRRTVRRGAPALRSDLLVIAADLPGLRDSLAGGELVGLDLRERRDVCGGSPSRAPNYRVVGYRRAGATPLVREWQAVWSGAGSGGWSGPRRLGRFLRAQLAARLAERSSAEKWGIEEPLIDWTTSPPDTNCEPLTRIGPRNPPRPFFAGERGSLAGTVELSGRSSWLTAGSGQKGVDGPPTEEVLSWLLKWSQDTENCLEASERAVLQAFLDDWLRNYLGPVTDWVGSGPRAGDPFPRQLVWHEVAALVHRFTPRWFLHPEDEHRFPGPALRWWLTHQPRAAVGTVAHTSVDAAAQLSEAAADVPVTLEAGRLGQSGPLRFVLGVSRLAPEPPGWTAVAPTEPWGRLLSERSLSVEVRGGRLQCSAP